MKRFLCLALMMLAARAFAEDRQAANPMDSGEDFVYLGEKGPVLMRLHVMLDGEPLSKVWREFMDEMFASLDVDKDGVLSKSEAERIPPVAVLFSNGGFGGQQPNLIASIDKDRNGKITRTELAEWYRKNGAAPFQFRMGGEGQNQIQFIIAGQSQPLSPDALNQKFLTLLDTNKDGKLSRAELTNAPAVLHKFDLDDDEMVNAQELSGNGPSNVEGAFAVAFADVQDNGRNAGPFFALDAGEANKALAQRLLQRYGRKVGKTMVKKLSREELGLDAEAFAKLDADQDGKLDGEELSRFGRRDPDLELRVRLGKKAAREAAMELISSKNRSHPLAKSVRTTSDGSLLVEFGTTQLEWGPERETGSVKFAVAVQQQYQEQFRMADKDKNGYLDRKEAEQSQIFRNLFRLMDADGDGKLFEKEVAAYLDRTKKLQESASRSCASLNVKDQGRGLFDLADANGDGRLSVREVRRIVNLIAQLDRDGDGQIALNEIPHKYRVDVRRGPANTNLFSGRAVFVTSMGGQEPKMPERSGPKWFQKMDRNHDGDVSRREFLGTEAEFRAIDRDEDGLISAEEARDADKNYRKRAEPKE